MELLACVDNIRIFLDRFYPETVGSIAERLSTSSKTLVIHGSFDDLQRELYLGGGKRIYDWFTTGSIVWRIYERWSTLGKRKGGHSDLIVVK